MIVLGPLALFGDTSILGLGASVTALLTFGVNMPHFMASYRILYRSKETILRYKGASMIMPGLLLAYMFFAVWKGETDVRHVGRMMFVGSVYLAWHYTGQIWGMMATYAFLAGAPFAPREKTLIRLGLRMQLVWHAAWVFQPVAENHASDSHVFGVLYLVMSVTTILAYLFAIAGFALYRRRTGKLPPLCASVAWLAMCVWYGALARHPDAIYWVQIAHAAQYLAFPLRVEINTFERAHPRESKRRVRLHLLFYFAALALVWGLVDWSSEHIAVAMLGELWGSVSGSVFPQALLAFVNIHHFFLDGCIWKISSPTVKEELFAHLKK